MYKEIRRFNGLTFTQAIDTTTDTAFYHDLNGNLLMKVDSSAVAYDAEGKRMGEFKTNHPQSTWRYVPEQGEEIVTNMTLLFDYVEPHVIGVLFGSGLGGRNV